MRRKKSKALAFVLAIFLGGLGIHHFYLKHWIRGVLYLLFCWTYVPIALAILIDLWFISRWVNRWNSNVISLSVTPNLAPTTKKSLRQRPSQTSKKLLAKPQSEPLSKGNKRFYDESALILPEYNHLRTPQKITLALHALEKLSQKNYEVDNGLTITYEFNTNSSGLLRDSFKYANISGKKCPHVPLQAYYTTYSHLNTQQRKWYFYWRSQVLQENYIQTDLSYLMLFTYELLNYSFNQNAAFNVSMLVRLHDNFKDSIQRSSHYLSGWIADTLWELGESNLAKEWDEKATRMYHVQPSLEEQIREQIGQLDKVSITVWKVLLTSEESDFLVSHRNAVYNTFKQGMRLLAQTYFDKRTEPLQLWFQDSIRTESRDLFRGAVMGRNHETIDIEHPERISTELFTNQVREVYKMAENLIRVREGADEVTIDQDIFPEGFITRYQSDFKEGFSHRKRFVRVSEGKTGEEGSSIPKPPSEAQSSPDSPPKLTLDFERLAQLKQESQMMVSEFSDLDNISDESVIPTPSDLNNEKPDIPEMNQDETQVSDIPMLKEEEIRLLQQFNGSGSFPVSEAQKYLRSLGLLPGVIIDGINQKLYSVLEDTFIEQDGAEYVIYEDYLDLLGQLRAGNDVNEFA